MSDMAVLSPHRFTVAEYHRIAESGALDDARVELIDGVIVEMSPIGSLHWRLHAHINAYLVDALRGVASLVPQGSFPLGEHNEPEPDFAIVEPFERDAPADVLMPSQIWAAIELSDSSLAKDLGPKLRLYGRFGIPDYLVVDLQAKTLLHHSDPHELGYRRTEGVGRGDRLSLTRLPHVVLEAAAFLP
jgi:Uma2 family endonuclease